MAKAVTVPVTIRVWKVWVGPEGPGLWPSQPHSPQPCLVPLQSESPPDLLIHSKYTDTLRVPPCVLKRGPWPWTQGEQETVAGAVVQGQWLPTGWTGSALTLQARVVGPLPITEPSYPGESLSCGCSWSSIPYRLKQEEP